MGHEWTAATCEKRETCNVCGKTQGDFLRHTTRQGYCGNCGLYVNELEDTYNSLVDTITVTWGMIDSLANCAISLAEA